MIINRTLRYCLLPILVKKNVDLKCISAIGITARCVELSNPWLSVGSQKPFHASLSNSNLYKYPVTISYEDVD